MEEPNRHYPQRPASPAGFEPATFRLGGERSILLSYEDVSFSSTIPHSFLNRKDTREGQGYGVI
jgi:hypothetical protein